MDQNVYQLIPKVVKWFGKSECRWQKRYNILINQVKQIMQIMDEAILQN
jgi:hypothetical protein